MVFPFLEYFYLNIFILKYKRINILNNNYGRCFLYTFCFVWIAVTLISSHLGTCVCGECSCHDVDPTGDWGDIHGDTCECDERDCRAVYDRYSDDFCSGKVAPDSPYLAESF